MRGTRETFRPAGFPPGIIPAYAGNTTAKNASTKANRDHPRVCGEHVEDGFHAGLAQGIIPAYAGNTAANGSPFWSRRDHPRVCGEHVRQSQAFHF